MNRFSRAAAWLSTKPCLIALFLFCAAPAGLSMTLLTPMGQAPDETAHLVRAAGLLHGTIITVRIPSVQSLSNKPIMNTGVDINAGLLMAAFGQTTAIGKSPHVLTAADDAAIRMIPWAGVRIFANIPNTATYFPGFYLPAAAGLVAGHLTRLSPYDSLHLARLAMLAAFLLVSAAALWLAPFGEALLLATLLLPMTLFLASTINPDGLLIATACLAAACLARDKAIHPKIFILGVVCLVLVILAKLPYLLLLGILLLPWRRAGWRGRVTVALLAFMPVLLWAVLVVTLSAVPFGKELYHPGPLWVGDHQLIFDRTDAAANLHILLAEPTRLFSLPYGNVALYGFQRFREIVGVLGQLSLQFPDWFYASWMIAWGLALLGLPIVARGGVAPSRQGPFWVESLYVLMLVVATSWGIMIEMYLNWTNVGAAVIDGVQGRYVIPLLPFLAFVMPYWRRVAVLPAVVPALPALALGILDLGFLPRQLVDFFYLH